MWKALSYIGTFVVGGICGGFLNHYGGYLLDKILGRINLEISPNPRSGAKYHAYWAASEVREHKEENNIFIISCDLNNHSKKPFIINEYSVLISTDKGDTWIKLDELTAKNQHLHPTSSLSISLGFEQFDDKPILISNLIGTDKLKGEFALYAIIAMKLPLASLRLNNRYDDSEILCRILLKERRGSTVIKDFHLNRMFYKKNRGSAELGYYDPSFREAIEGSGVLVKE